MQTGTFPLGQVPLDATPSSAAPTPEPDPGWGVGLRFPRARRPFSAAILAAAIIYTPEAIAAPQAPDVLPVLVRPAAARRLPPARPIIYVDTPAPDQPGWAVLTRPPAPRARGPRPPVAPPEDYAATLETGAVLVRFPARHRPAYRPIIDTPEAPVVVVVAPPAAGGGAIYPRAGRTVIIPRTAFVDAPAAPVVAPDGADVLVRFPARQRFIVRRPTIEPPPGVVIPTGWGWDAVLERRPLARRTLTPAVRGPINPPIVLVVGVANPEVLVRYPAKRRFIQRTRVIWTDPTPPGPPPPDFDVLCVSIVATWPRWTGTVLTSPDVSLASTWPRWTGTLIITPLWDTPSDDWPRVINIDLECCGDD